MNIEKVALVTGSGKQRVGWHVANALAAPRLCDRCPLPQLGRRGQRNGRAVSEPRRAGGRVCRRPDRRAAGPRPVEKVLGRFDRLDVLVNAAAAWKSKRLEDVTAGDVRGYFETNTLGTFLCCQQAGLAMVRQPEGGSIITIGDWATVRPYTNYAAYFPSKGAIPTLTRVMAVELGTRNPHVRVNCIMPGPVLLPPDLPPAEREQAINATLVKREGKPENIALAVLHFIDNDFVTGVCLPVDGGRTIYAVDSES